MSELAQHKRQINVAPASSDVITGPRRTRQEEEAKKQEIPIIPNMAPGKPIPRPQVIEPIKEPIKEITYNVDKTETIIIKETPATWQDIDNKPFDTLGDTLRVSEGVLDINIYETSNLAGGYTLIVGK